MVRVVILLLLLAPQSVNADTRSQARLHYEEGTKAFDLGLYDQAINEYMAAYQLRNDPVLLYNLGQAHRLAGHLRDALRFYRVYLQRLPEADNRVEVERKIAELKIAVEKLELPPDNTLGPKVRPPENEPGEPVPSTPPAPAPKTPPPPGRDLRIGGLATGAAGLGLVAVGIAFGVLAQQASNNLSSTSHMGGFYDPAQYTRGKNDQIVEGVTLAIGAAAVGTGVVLYVLGRRQVKRDVAWQR